MKNYSYVTYLTDDTYAYGIVLLVASMKNVKTKYPLHVLITKDVSAPTIELLNQLQVTYELVDIIPMPEQIQKYNESLDKYLSVTWKNCCTQFKIFDLTQFDKILFLDADIMILKNIDNLFNLPHLTAALDGEYFNLWPEHPHFNTGCMVIEPSHEEFLNIVNFTNNFNPKDHYREEPIANQEILNSYFKDWPDKNELHLNKYYNIFPPYVYEQDKKDLRFKTKFVHFVGRKPWTFWINGPQDTYDEEYYNTAKDLIQEWINKLDWEKIHEKVVLTVYGICKNEIESIDNYLKSFSAADHVCILDTGSTDGTWQFLQEATKKYPNLIIDQKVIDPWRFDTARNENMKMIPDDTVMFFMADMDEVIKDENWVEKIKEVWSPTFSRGVYTYNREVDEQDTVYKQTIEYRIHSKEWTTWINIVHEALIDKYGEKFFYSETAAPIDITVWHYPKKEGFTNYMELCEQAVKENPTDWVMHLQLAIEYEIRDQIDKALDVFEFLIHTENTLQPCEVARCFYGAGHIFELKEDYDSALFLYLQGRLIDSSSADNYLSAAKLYIDLKEYKKAIELCEEALQICHQTEWCNAYDINSYYPYFLLALGYHNLGDFAKALGYMVIVDYKNPTEDGKQIIYDIVQDVLNKEKGI